MTDSPVYLTIWDRVCDKRGLAHREDGPAYVFKSGKPEWRLDGNYYTFDNYCRKLNLSPEKELELRLKWL